MKQSIEEHSGRKYLRTIHSALPDNDRPPLTIDVYCVLDAFDVTSHPIGHAIKKLLCAGIRDKGSKLKDLEEARDAISRAIEQQQIKEKQGGTDKPA